VRGGYAREGGSSRGDPSQEPGRYPGHGGNHE